MRGARRRHGSPWATHVLLLGATALFCGVGPVLPGPLGLAAVLLGLASLTAWAGWTHGRLRVRRGGSAVPRDLERLTASRLSSGALLVALLLACAAEVAAVAALVLEPAAPAGTSTGRFTPLVPIVIGAGLVVATLVRAATGGLHPFELVLDEDGLRYRGWRTDRRVAWHRVREVGTDRVRCELVVQPKGTAEGPVRVPLVMFDAEVTSLVGAIEGRRAARRPRRSG